MRNYIKKEDVIKFLKKRKQIYSQLEKVYGSTFNVVYQSRKYWIEHAGKRMRIHHSTILSLQNNKIIDIKYNLL